MTPRAPLKPPKAPISLQIAAIPVLGDEDRKVRVVLCERNGQVVVEVLMIDDCACVPVPIQLDLTGAALKIGGPR